MYNKQLFYKGLDQKQVLVDDTINNSPYYFNIIDIPTEFGPGKNSIRFNLNSNNLDINKPIEIELIDSYNNVIYNEILDYTQPDEFGVSLLTVYFYNNTANGPITITFIGYGLVDLDGNDISEYNYSPTVKYTTVINFNRFKKNSSKLLFSESPTINISEFRVPFLSQSLSDTSVLVYTGSGKYSYKQNTPILELTSNDIFFNDLINGNITLSGSLFSPDLSNISTLDYNTHSTKVVNFLNAKTAILDIPWTASLLNISETPITTLFDSVNNSFSITYIPTSNRNTTENYKSFVNLKINNLDPISGTLKKIKLFGKSRGSVSNYELIGESFIENSELLINYNSIYQYDRRNVGYFLDSSSFNNFWSYNNTVLSASFTSSSLFNSIYLTPLINSESSQILFSSNVNINFQKKSPYRIYFNYFSDSDFSVNVLMSGSAFKNNTNENIGEFIANIDSKNYGKVYRNFSVDFLASNTGIGNIQFQIKTGSFYISDISIKSGIEQGFTPSNFNSYFPINVKSRNDKYDFKIDLIDDLDQVSSYTNEGSNIAISGSNFYLEGEDNISTGLLTLGKTLASGILLDGNSSKISTKNFDYENSRFAFWSGSQIISGSFWTGSGFIYDSGAPTYHYIHCSENGIDIKANVPTNTEFYLVSSSINETILNLSSSILPPFTGSLTPEYFATMFGLLCDFGNDGTTYNLQLQCDHGTPIFKITAV